MTDYDEEMAEYYAEQKRLKDEQTYGKNLTIEQWVELKEQWDVTPGVNDGNGSGAHYLLTNILNKLGYHSLTRSETMMIAEGVLTYGHPNYKQV